MKKNIIFALLGVFCGVAIITAKSALELVNIALADPNAAKNQKEIIDTIISVGNVPFKGGVAVNYKKAFGDKQPEGLPSSFYQETDKNKKLDYITQNILVPALQGVDPEAVKRFKAKIPG